MPTKRKNETPEEFSIRRRSEREPPTENRKKYKKQYTQRPNVIDKRRAKQRTPEYRLWQNAYNNRAEVKVRKAAQRKERKEIIRQQQKARKEILKKQVFDYYSNKCICCGENEPLFLTIDHINNDGKKDRQEAGRAGLYKRIVKKNFPDTYRILCYNCNCGRARNNRICPHETKSSTL